MPITWSLYRRAVLNSMWAAVPEMIKINLGPNHSFLRQLVKHDPGSQVLGDGKAASLHRPPTISSQQADTTVTCRVVRHCELWRKKSTEQCKGLSEQVHLPQDVCGSKRDLDLSRNKIWRAVRLLEEVSATAVTST